MGETNGTVTVLPAQLAPGQVRITPDPRGGDGFYLEIGRAAKPKRVWVRASEMPGMFTALEKQAPVRALLRERAAKKEARGNGKAEQQDAPQE